MLHRLTEPEVDPERERGNELRQPDLRAIAPAGHLLCHLRQTVGQSPRTGYAGLASRRARGRWILRHPAAAEARIREGDLVCVVDDPGVARELISPLPPGAMFASDPRSAQVVMLFVSARRALEEQVDDLGQAVFPDRSLWIAWPKRSSGIATDMTEDVVREIGLPVGLVDNKVCAIDATWSGLRLVWRRELRT